jgi:hypothetical protein
MSCYILHTEDFQKIANSFAAFQQSPVGLYNLKRKIKNINALNFTNSLIDLNVESVNNRYKEENNAEHLTTVYPTRFITSIELFKKLQSLLAQLDSADTAKLFYLQLKDIINSLAIDIVEELPEYESAEY